MRRLPLLLGLLVPAIAAAAVVAGDWPRWRGPFNTGVARGGAPVEWSATKNVKWKVEVPGRGHSSPVIWEDRIYLTTAVPRGQGAAPSREGSTFGSTEAQPEYDFLVLCYDKDDGSEIWRQTALTAAPHEGYHATYGSFASNSPVTDGETLIAFFGSRGVFAYHLDGKLRWKKNLGVEMRMRNAFGEGVAPVLHDNVLLLTFDHEGQSFLAALDKRDGKELWRVERDEPSNWAPPLVLEHEGALQAVVAATNKVRSYELSSGKLIWEASGLGLNTIPAPVTDGERVYVMSGYRDPNLLAIRLGGEGDLTGSEAIEWTNQRGNAYTASPVLEDGVLYVVTDRGMLSAFDTATGEPHYLQQRLPNPYSFKSSPVAADGKLYLATEQGDVVVVAMGTGYKPLAVNSMGDEFFIATPAVSDGELFLRGRTTLYCISGQAGAGR